MKASEIPRSIFDPKWSIQKENKVNLQEDTPKPVQEEVEEIVATDESEETEEKDTEDAGEDVTDETE